MKKIFIQFMLIFMIFICCSRPSDDTITQISTIDALLAGLYDGQMTCSRLMEYGNLGIGTFDRLDGEMIVLDGKVYQVKVDGKIYAPEHSAETPFASITHFQPEKADSIKTHMDFQTIEAWIDGMVTNQNLFCAIKIHGDFALMQTRSVPAQSKPYPPLAEVSKKQSVFNMNNITGTIVGFRCPSYVSGINVPGYHLHFISDDLTSGGHILDFRMIRGLCELDVCNRFFLILPMDEAGFQSVDLTRDRTEELERIER